MPNHNITTASGHRLVERRLWRFGRQPCRPDRAIAKSGIAPSTWQRHSGFASSRYPRNTSVEIGCQMGTEVTGVVASAIDEGGFSAAQELTADEVHARRTNDPSVMPDHA